MVAAPLSPPVRIEPPTLAEQVSEKWLTELKQSDIKLVMSYSYFGGSLFVKNDHSFLVSGSVSGWVHFAKDEGIYANVVSDFDSYVDKVREEKPDADKFMLVKRINDHWGIFLHAF